MSEVSMTTISAKGQVVIPDWIRKSMHIHAGDRFAVAGNGDTVILKRITVPSASELFGELGKKARAHAKARGLREKDVVRLIHEGRGVLYD
ncbi:AbrB/MazE/SpoVT family DNA-binding domain-containing protein [Candidatus Micrarchaeota archaeon]|nr:AbrB/MazE/SpoVT family DNA-binding domain-containing protein [Candidatus Micrarchaeota archaeon]